MSHAVFWQHISLNRRRFQKQSWYDNFDYKVATIESVEFLSRPFFKRLCDNSNYLSKRGLIFTFKVLTFKITMIFFQVHGNRKYRGSGRSMSVQSSLDPYGSNLTLSSSNSSASAGLTPDVLSNQDGPSPSRCSSVSRYSN